MYYFWPLRTARTFRRNFWECNIMARRAAFAFEMRKWKEFSGKRFSFSGCVCIYSFLRYKEAARRLSDQLRNKPFSPEDILVRYVEHAIRFNVTASLNNISSHQTFIKYYMLDVIIPFILICLLIVAITLRLVYYMISFMWNVSHYVKIAKVKQHWAQI